MDIQRAELTVEIGFADLGGSAEGKRALEALQALAAAQAGRMVGLPAHGAEVVGMGKVTCRVSLSVYELDNEVKGSEHEQIQAHTNAA